MVESDLIFFVPQVAKALRIPRKKVIELARTNGIELPRKTRRVRVQREREKALFRGVNPADKYQYRVTTRTIITARALRQLGQLTGREHESESLIQQSLW